MVQAVNGSGDKRGGATKPVSKHRSRSVHKFSALILRLQMFTIGIILSEWCSIGSCSVISQQQWLQYAAEDKLMGMYCNRLTLI